MKTVNFYEAFFKARLLYGIEDNFEELEELGLIAWEKINTKHSKLYRYLAEVDKGTLSIELPCNCDQIEAVNTCREEWNRTSNIHRWGLDIHSLFTETYIEFRKRNLDPLYAPGEFIPYEISDGIMYFTQYYPKVQILYKGYVADDQGLPLITDNQAEAIATFIAFTKAQKQGYINRDPKQIEWAMFLENKWRSQCANARVSTYLSQNEMDEILDAKNSWNRKIYKKSLKSIQ